MDVPVNDLSPQVPLRGGSGGDRNPRHLSPKGNRMFLCYPAPSTAAPLLLRRSGGSDACPRRSDRSSSILQPRADERLFVTKQAPVHAHTADHDWITSSIQLLQTSDFVLLKIMPWDMLTSRAPLRAPAQNSPESIASASSRRDPPPARAPQGPGNCKQFVGRRSFNLCLTHNLRPRVPKKRRCAGR